MEDDSGSGSGYVSRGCFCLVDALVDVAGAEGFGELDMVEGEFNELTLRLNHIEEMNSNENQMSIY
jgi:hypothetical protein